MSFILDALRKSEAARRRSEAPDLFATMPAAPEPARTHASWPLWLLGAVAALSLTATLWLLAQRMPETPKVPPIADTAAQAAPRSASIDNDTIAAPDPATTSTPVMPASVPASVPEPSPTTAQAPPLDRTPPVAATLPPPATPLTSPTREPPEPPPEPADIPPPLPPAGSAVTLAELDPAVRKLLPPLKLSMHLWNETAAQRFVILDGQRLREGDLLGELVIERITREGAVLVWRGGQLRIELR